MRNWLKFNRREVKVGFDSRQVLKDELLRICLVNLALSEADNLQLVHVIVEVCL